MNIKLQNNIKKLNLVTIALIVACNLLITVTPVNNAGVISLGWESAKFVWNHREVLPEMIDGATEVVSALNNPENFVNVELIQSIISTPSAKINPVIEDFQNELIGDAWEQYSYGGSGDSGNTQGGGISLYNLFLYMAVFICFMIALSHFVTNIDRGQDPVQCVFKILIEIGVTGVFLINLNQILELLCSLGIALCNDVGSPSSAANSISKENAEVLLEALTGQNSGKVTWQMMAGLTLLLPAALSMVATVLMYVTLFSIILEINIRRLFAPLAVVDIYGEGWRSMGARYLKKFFGCYLKIIIMIVTFNIGSTLMINLLDSVFASMLEQDAAGFTGAFMLCVGISISTAIFALRSGEIVNDIVGA